MTPAQQESLGSPARDSRNRRRAPGALGAGRGSRHRRNDTPAAGGARWTGLAARQIPRSCSGPGGGSLLLELDSHGRHPRRARGSPGGRGQSHPKWTSSAHRVPAAGSPCSKHRSRICRAYPPATRRRCRPAPHTRGAFHPGPLNIGPASGGDVGEHVAFLHPASTSASSCNFAS